MVGCCVGFEGVVGDDFVDVGSFDGDVQSLVVVGCGDSWELPVDWGFVVCGCGDCW